MGLFNFKIFGGRKPDLDKIEKDLAALGLGLQKIRAVLVSEDDGIVRLIAWARTLADKEKALIAVGNMDNVSKVEDRIRIGEPPALPAPAATAPPAAGATATAAVIAADTDDDAEPTAAEAPTAVFYTVKSGDTLSKIARQHYGNANEYDRIFEANKPMLKHPDKIYPGQVLRIPPKD